MFRYGETKQFLRKIVILPTVLSVTFFDAGSFLKHKRVFQQFFGSVRQKTLTEIVNIRPPPTYPENDSKLLFSETQKVSPTMFFDTVRYQLFDGKLWCPLFFYPRKFSMPELFWNIERTMYKVSRHCETKDFQRNLVISPFFTKDVSIPEFIWNTEGVPYDVFRRCETKIFQLELVICRSYA